MIHPSRFGLGLLGLALIVGLALASSAQGSDIVETIELPPAKR